MIGIDYHVSFHTKIIRKVLRTVFRLIFLMLGPVKITGKENVPSAGAYLIAINHISIYEAPFVVAFWPVAPEVAGAAVVWERPGQSLLARLYAGIPVHRGKFDRRLIDSSLAALDSGKPLLIAPEGGRSRTPGMRQANPGVAYLVNKSGLSVIPVGVVGTTEDYFRKAVRLKRPTLEMRIGKQLVLPPITGKGIIQRENRQRNADLIMAHIASLLPPEYQGVYSDYKRVINDSKPQLFAEKIS